MYTHVSMLPYIVRLVPQPTPGESALAKFERRVHKHLPEWAGGYPPPLKSQFKTPDHGGGNYRRDIDAQFGAPFMVARQPLMTADGTPCGPPPFGSIVAINLNTGRKLWTIPNGEMARGELGGIGMSGPIATAGGLLFVASLADASLRAYNSTTGQELWRGKLPGSANATPMTYMWRGQQYVVIEERGDHTAKDGQRDALIAFALPQSKHGPMKSDK